ncbi:GTPase [Methylolobus aquaticus]
MSDDGGLQRLRDKAVSWSQRAVAQGWLTAQESARLERLEHRSPDALFEGLERRPLVVAFFGGTGVGKSTLLNRLAGREVARTGVIRPTSREITVYLHESVRMRPLPSYLPLDRIHAITHDSERYKDVLWVDTPDFDSMDRTNHDLALQWLPHIDVLVYVVSPERYRDDRGWRILLQHERDHAWIFVINQWDRAHPSQLPDFERLLAEGGFDAPLVFRTASVPESAARPADDFALLEATIRDLSEQRTMALLTEHNLQGRFNELADTIDILAARFGQPQSFKTLRESWAELWRATAAKLRKGLQWPMDEFVMRFVNREADPLRRSMDLNTARSVPAEGPVLTLLWDDWAQLCFDDALDRLLIDAEAIGLPSPPLRNALQPLRHQASRWVLDAGQTSLREALARPGTRGQRLLLKLAGLLSVIAPLGATGWVAYEVVVLYYRSVQAETPFLGTEFAIHSALLIAVAWLLPYAAQHKLKPSTEKTARRGLERGLEQAFDTLREAVDDQLDAVSDTATAMRSEAADLIQRGREPMALQGTDRAAGSGSAERTLARARR